MALPRPILVAVSTQESLKGHIPNLGSRPSGGAGRGGDTGIRVVKLVQAPPGSGKPSAGVALSQQAKAAPPQAQWVTRRRGTPQGQEQQQDKLPHPTAQGVIRVPKKGEREVKKPQVATVTSWPDRFHLPLSNTSQFSA